MVAGDVARIIRAPGRVVIGPTDLSAAYPYGGVEIGLTTLCAIQSFGTPFPVLYESLGEAGEVLEGNKSFVFTCFVRGIDDNAVEQLWSSANYSAGSVSAHAVLKEPGTRVPGEGGIARAVILLYTPDDIVHVPSLLIYRGVPDWGDGAEMLFQRGSELGIPIAINCLRDGNNLIYSMGRHSDLSLTA